MSFVIGLDLGQSADYTALSIVQDVLMSDAKGKKHRSLHLRHLERYPLRTLYPDIAEGVSALMRDPKLSPDEFYGGTIRRKAPELVVDQTGVGPAVTDLLKQKGLTSRVLSTSAARRISISRPTR
jgi:hypothetical protein